jgi:hypothetical protein
MYVCGLGYCGGHGTDGVVKFAALPFIHGTKRLAEMCTQVGLWVPHPKGWVIPNWDLRQETSAVSDAKKVSQSQGGKKGACIKYHGAACGCWKTGDG